MNKIITSELLQLAAVLGAVALGVAFVVQGQYAFGAMALTGLLGMANLSPKPPAPPSV